MSQNEDLPGLIKLLSHRIVIYVHLFAYVAVSLLLILIWAVTLPQAEEFYFIPFFPMFGWGFGMGFHAIIYLMYNDKVKFLSELRKQDSFKLLFIFHLWFYCSINIFLLIVDLTTTPGILWFFWPLAMWGIAFAFHVYGFFTFDKFFDKHMTKVREEHPDYSKKRMKETARIKMAGFGALLIHATYFVVVNILIYVIPISLAAPIPSEQIQNTVNWCVLFGLHIFGYCLFTYVKTIKPEMKGLLFHITLYVGIIAILLYEQFTPEQTIFWWHIPAILWPIAIAIHVLVSLRWDKIKPSAFEKVKTRYREGLEDYEYQKHANGLIFWNWSFIAHIFIYILGVILLYAQFNTLSIATEVFIIATLGWLIGLLVHGAIYIVALKNIIEFLMWTAVLHIAAYIGGIPLLITLNILNDPTILWSAIALGGWAIGLGAHLLIAFLTRKK